MYLTHRTLSGKTAETPSTAKSLTTRGPTHHPTHHGRAKPISISQRCMGSAEAQLHISSTSWTVRTRRGLQRQIMKLQKSGALSLFKDLLG